MTVRPCMLPILALALTACPAIASTSGPTITVNESRTLPTAQLARALLGERLAANVIEAVRHEYGPSGGTPRDVEFYTRPQLPWPRINGICRTDVITVEYDWFEFDRVEPSTLLRIFHVEATSRYLAFPMPPGEPGSPENERAQEAACARFSTVLDAFRAPSPGDGQWLAAIERQYLRSSARNRRFDFTCSDFADPSCGQAASALPNLPLRSASDVRAVDCPPARRSIEVRNCYRLAFPYAGRDTTEWILTVSASMRDGMAPVEIRSMNLERLN